MPEAVWWALNLIVGVPIAVVLLGVGRESIRALLALALGFRVFELRWGIGEPRWARPIGPVEFAIGPIPLAGSILAESGSARHHALSRLIQAGVPLLLQVVGAIGLGWMDRTLSEGLRSGYAPLAAFQIANLLLIALHGLFPFEAESGFRSDIRSILDALFGRAETNRRARASYYARYARHWLERSQVDRAGAMLERGLTQLGPDPLLVACQSRLRVEDLASVVDQSACADALRALILEAEPRRWRSRSTWSRSERFRQALTSAIPLTLAVLVLLIAESEALSRLAHDRLIVVGDLVATERDPMACESQLDRWKRWTPLLDRVLPGRAEMDRDRRAQLARLEECRGKLDAAEKHRDRAISAAEQVLKQLALTPDPDPTVWLENEIRLTLLLRHAAELDGERKRYRLALATLGSAANRLVRVESRLRIEFEPAFSIRANELLEQEKRQLESVRHEIRRRMSAR